ncbi:hypothetical protein K493DRAFT_318478 [Basidiobolus meristosporus CBS 931.73]|uniref:Uncharacterized protein n=1 Tax=Basidiobolus meristosporus CBS 931.73 TaxID=1314790 RepID=A0A1Y1XWN1_9FUNG|nr:hypothetical protein K493DRAFT_318478 [Basidiobolus meristosporus CBS 931.73]|eukprot:ORX89754.1 hypothetical protein K493DRAFT_318478 [Basidiobolus meristosporus CBS 931.73]
MSRDQLELALLKASSRHDDVYNQIVFTSQSLDKAQQTSKSFDQVVYWYEKLESNSLTMNQRFYLLSAITSSLAEHITRFRLNDPTSYFQVWSEKGIYQMKRSKFTSKVGERWKSLFLDFGKGVSQELGYQKSDWRKFKKLVDHWEAIFRAEDLTLGHAYEIKLLVEREISGYHSYYFSKDLVNDSSSESISAYSAESEAVSDLSCQTLI